MNTVTAPRELESKPVITPSPVAPAERRDIDFAQIGTTLANNAWLILAVTLGVLALAMIVALRSPMQFQSTGSLYLGENNQPIVGRDDEMRLRPVSTPGDWQSQLEILKSRTLIERAIMETGMNTRVSANREHKLTMWHWLTSGKDHSLLQPSGSAIKATMASVSRPDLVGRPLQVTFLSGGAYQVRDDNKRILAEGRLGQPVVGQGFAFKLDAAHPNYMPPAGAQYNLTIYRPADVYHSVMDRLKITLPKASTDKSTAVVNLEYSDNTPAQASSFLNALMTGYLAQNLRWKTEEAAATENFVKEQMNKVRTELAQADQRLADYKRRSGVVMMSQEAQAMTQQLADYETQRTAARLQAYALQQMRAAVNRPNAPIETYLLSQVDDPVLSTMTTNLAKAQADLRKTQQDYTNRSPEVQQAAAVMNQEKSAITAYIDNKSAMANQRLADLDRIIGESNAKMRTLPETELQLASATRNTEVLGKTYTFLLQKQQEAALAKAATISNNRILDTATQPDHQIKPNLPRTALLAILLGLFLGVVAALLKSRFANTIQSEEEIRQRFADVPLLASVPHGELADAPSATGTRYDATIDTDTYSNFAEAFRSLRANLYYADPNNQERVILLTSSAPSDGKTTTASNLAHTLAQDGKRVLLVDADLRKPAELAPGQTKPAAGLSEVLKGEKGWRQVRVTLKQSPNGEVDIVGSGALSPNRMQLLSSDKLGEFLTEAKQEYDYIILDSAPYPLVSDSMLLAQHADQIISLVRVKNSPRRPTIEHIKRFGNMGKPYGLVINDVKMGDAYGYGYKYGQKYV